MDGETDRSQTESKRAWHLTQSDPRCYLYGVLRGGVVFDVIAMVERKVTGAWCWTVWLPGGLMHCETEPTGLLARQAAQRFIEGSPVQRFMDDIAGILR